MSALGISTLRSGDMDGFELVPGGEPDHFGCPA